MKALVNFYWKGKLIKAGDEAPKGVPAHLVEKKVVKRTRKAK